MNEVRTACQDFYPEAISSFVPRIGGVACVGPAKPLPAVDFQSFPAMLPFPAMPDSSAPILACFAFERGDARVRKRVAALQAQGWRVKGYMFHRVRDKVDEPPFWENVELGITENRQYLKRVFVLLFSLRILWRHRAALREATVFYVVNTDNALLALAARWMARRPAAAGPGAPSVPAAAAAQAPLVLELADVPHVMLGKGWAGKIMRALERFVLRRTAMLVTTSPGFVRNYFTPVQRFKGPVFLLENKVYPSAGLAGSRCDAGPTTPADPGGSPTPTSSGVPSNSTSTFPSTSTSGSVTPSTPAPGPVRGGRPWVIGLFGAFRCPRSMAMLKGLAARFPDRIHVYLRGYPSGVDPEAMTALLTGLPNLESGGAYHYPDDLAGMYGRIDFNWTFDFSIPSGNSAWLLPNRIYEGGLFACPALADAATETGAWVETHRTGWTFAEPLEESLAAFFEGLTADDWRKVRNECARLPREATCGEEDYQNLSRSLHRLADGGPALI